jgi:hypothetical protein
MRLAVAAGDECSATSPLETSVLLKRRAGRFSQNNLGSEGGEREGVCAKMTMTFGYQMDDPECAYVWMVQIKNVHKIHCLEHPVGVIKSRPLLDSVIYSSSSLFRVKKKIATI